VLSSESGIAQDTDLIVIGYFLHAVLKLAYRRAH